MKLCIFKCYLNASKASDPRWVTCNNSRQSSYLEIQTIQCLSPLGGRKLTLSVRNKVLDSIPHWGIEQRHRKTCYSPAVLLFSHWVIFHVVPWATAHQPSLSFTSFQSLLKLMSIELVMPSNILSSVVPFSFCLQSLPASGSFLMSWLFASGGQSIGASSSASVLPMNIQGWFPLGWTGWISLQSKGLSRVFSNTTVQKHQFFGAPLSS